MLIFDRKQAAKMFDYMSYLNLNPTERQVKEWDIAMAEKILIFGDQMSDEEKAAIRVWWREPFSARWAKSRREKGK